MKQKKPSLASALRAYYRGAIKADILIEIAIEQGYMLEFHTNGDITCRKEKVVKT